MAVSPQRLNAEMELQKVQKRLDLLTAEYNKLVNSHAELQKRHHLMMCSNNSSGSVATNLSDDNFPVNILRFIGTLLFNERFSDVSMTFRDESDRPVPCHTFVLEARGFKCKRDSSSEKDSDSDPRIVNMCETSREIGSAMLKWMYTDTLELSGKSESFLMDMLRVSSDCNLSELKQLTEQSLAPFVHTENVIKMYQVAVQSSANTLKQHCSAVMFSHWHNFSHSDFEPLDTDTLFFILKQRSETPLHAAIRLRREDIVYKYLIEYTEQLPTSINAPDETGEVALFIALNTDQASVASLLVEHGADVNVQFAIPVFKNEEITNSPTSRPLLHYFIILQQFYPAQFLLDATDIDVAQPARDSLDTALHAFASVKEPTDETLSLLDRILNADDENLQVNVNLTNSLGQSALHCSIHNRNFKVFERLLGIKTTDVNIMNHEKENALWLAVKQDEREFEANLEPKFSSALLKRGAKIDINITNDNVPFLNYLAEHLYENAAIYFVQQKCNINHQDSNGLSVLHIACMNNLANLVSTLLNIGANCNIHTKYVAAEKPRPGPPPPLPKISVSSPLPISPSSEFSEKSLKKKKIVKKKVVKRVLKQKKSNDTFPFNNVASNPELKKQSSLNPFDEDDGDAEGWASNPFADPDNVSISTNPFEEAVPSERNESPPEDEFEEIEEWIDEEVTDDDFSDPDVSVISSSQLGNAITNFSFGDTTSTKPSSANQNESFEEEESTISLASEASHQTPLHLAIWHKHENIVRLMIEFKRTNPEKLNLDEKNSFEQTPFALSLWLGLNCADELLKAGSNINDRNAIGECLLQQAIMHQDSSSALFLLDRNADFSFRSANGDSPLMSAIKRHLPLVVDALCIRGADMSQTDTNNNLPLWVALETGQEDVASILVKHGCDANGWHISPRDGYFQTMLHRAIKEKNEAVACFLVRCCGNVDLEAVYQESAPGCNLNERARQDLDRQDTPGHLAARLGLAGVLLALLEHGFKVNSKNSEKKTCLHIAIESENSNCVDVLMTCHEVSLSAKDARGSTPFGYTLKYKNDRAANLILQRDPSAVEHLDNRGRSLLHLAAQSIDLQSVLFLLTCRANVNVRMQDKSDMTPLHVAALSAQPNNDSLQMIMRNLILAGANVNAVTRVVQTALHLAADRGSHELCAILLENGGADVNIQDAEGNTPLQLAVKSRHVYTIKRILELSKNKIDLRLKNARGRNVLHTLAACSSKADSTSVMSIFPLLLNAAGNTLSLNDEDSEGNTMLLLAYINGHSQLCRALVTRGVTLGTVNKQALSIFTYPAPTTDLLHGLLKLVSSEPKWSESDVCMECVAKFTVTFRRHHCRHCGRELCAPCSQQMSPIPKFHLDKNVRVCKHCYHVIRMGGAI